MALILALLFFSCSRKINNENYILLALNESALGWIDLRIKKDSTFELEAGGIGGSGQTFSGTVEIRNDSLFLHYDSIASPCGSKAVISEKFLRFVDANACLGRFEIKANRLTKE